MLAQNKTLLQYEDFDKCTSWQVLVMLACVCVSQRLSVGSKSNFSTTNRLAEKNVGAKCSWEMTVQYSTTRHICFSQTVWAWTYNLSEGTTLFFIRSQNGPNHNVDFIISNRLLSSFIISHTRLTPDGGSSIFSAILAPFSACPLISGLLHLSRYAWTYDLDTGC